MRPRLVDPIYLRVNKSKNFVVDKTIYKKNDLPTIPIKWILLFVFICLIVLYLWDFVKNNDPNPELDFLPQHIRESLVGVPHYGIVESQEVSENLLVGYNDDMCNLEFKHI